MGVVVTEFLSWVAICVLGPVVCVAVVFVGGRLSGGLSGYGRLARLYPPNGGPPSNTQVRQFLVGVVGTGMGSLGSDSGGLYVYDGMLGEPIRVPWNALRLVYAAGPVALLREREVGTLLTIPRSLLPADFPARDIKVSSGSPESSPRG